MRVLKLLRGVIKNRSFFSKIPVLFRMLKATKSGEYKMNKSNMIIAVLTLVYLFSPLDLIPDWFPLLGIFDDIGLFTIAISKLMKETDEFLLWEESKRNYKKI